LDLFRRPQGRFQRRVLFPLLPFGLLALGKTRNYLDSKWYQVTTVSKVNTEVKKKK
jgi:hypothetical protein